MADETRVDWLEGDSGRIAFTLKDENGQPVQKSALDSLTLDLYHLADDGTTTTINGREAQDVLDANDVTVHATTGEVTWDVQREDVPFLGSDPSTTAAACWPARRTSSQVFAPQYETHVARFTVAWDTTEQKSYAIVMRVKNVRRYTVS